VVVVVVVVVDGSDRNLPIWQELPVRLPGDTWKVQFLRRSVVVVGS